MKFTFKNLPLKQQSLQKFRKCLAYERHSKAGTQYSNLKLQFCLLTKRLSVQVSKTKADVVTFEGLMG